MLEFFGLCLLIVAAIMLVVIFFANLGSPTGATIVPFWPAFGVALIGIGLLVAHHFLRNVPLSW